MPYTSYTWVDDDTLVACMLPPGLGPPPPEPRAPLGPKIEDNSSGKKSQARTYPDLLKSPYDEKLFEYYTTSQLLTVKVRGRRGGHSLSVESVKEGVGEGWQPLTATSSCRCMIGAAGGMGYNYAGRLLEAASFSISCLPAAPSFQMASRRHLYAISSFLLPLNQLSKEDIPSLLQVSTGEAKLIGPDRMYTAVSPSPDGRYFLVAYLEKPFSYAVPCGRFPKKVELWDR